MKKRCYDKNSTAYKNYGGRGIKVCRTWRNDFITFYDWAMVPKITVAVPEMAAPEPTAEPIAPMATELPAVWWTEDEAALLAALISAESRGEPYEGQLAVGCVVLNRLENGAWGVSLHEVIDAPGQFATPHWDYGESAHEAALECLNSNRFFPADVLFFQVRKVAVWHGATWVETIGNHNFYLKEDGS